MPYYVTSGPYSGGPVTVEHDNLVKVYSLHGDVLGRGHISAETKGPVWVSCLFTYPGITTPDIAFRPSAHDMVSTFQLPITTHILVSHQLMEFV